jgi:hypothetical protein
MLAVVVTMIWVLPLYGGAPATKTIPFATIEQAVRRTFAAQGDRRTGDLIVRSEAEAALRQVEKAGWKVPRREEILRKVHGDQDFLAENLRTPAGMMFMRQISGYRLGYDRLDRLSDLPRGQQMVLDLIRGPDGYKMIEYMTSEPGGKEMGRMLNGAVNGAGFNNPTGRIYTVNSLVAELKRVYDASLVPTPGKPAKR